MFTCQICKEEEEEEKIKRTNVSWQKNGGGSYVAACQR